MNIYFSFQFIRDNDRERGYDRGGIERRGGDRDGSRGFDHYEPPRDRGGFDRGEHNFIINNITSKIIVINSKH